MKEELKLIEGEIVPVYENEKGERLINARELHTKLGNKRKFADWIKQRIEHYKFAENQDFIPFHNFEKGDKNGFGNKSTKEYYLTIDTAKELCMVENNEIGRKIRRYFIEVEKRYRSIVETPQNIFDVMHLALNQIEENEKRLSLVENVSKQNTEEIQNIKKKTKGNQYYQVYYKPKAVKQIVDWFNKNKEEIEYKIIYERNTKNGKKGQIKEYGYKIENVCYKIKGE